MLSEHMVALFEKSDVIRPTGCSALGTTFALIALMAKFCYPHVAAVPSIIARVALEIPRPANEWRRSESDLPRLQLKKHVVAAKHAPK